MFLNIKFCCLFTHAHCTLGGSIVQLFDVKNLALVKFVVTLVKKCKIVSNYYFLRNKDGNALKNV